MTDLERYQQAKQRAEEAARDLARAEGALAQIKTRLQAFGVATLAAADAKLRSLEREVAKEEKALAAALDKFEAEWQRRTQT